MKKKHNRAPPRPHAHGLADSVRGGHADAEDVDGTSDEKL